VRLFRGRSQKVASRTRRGVTPAQVALAAVLLAGAAGGGQVAAAGVPSHCGLHSALPDAGCTPGLRNTAVTQTTIQSTICKPGFTRTIRPPVNYTDHLKLQLMVSYGLKGQPSAYELDHFIALELGGNPTSPANLWPEPYLPTPGAHQKDKVENYLHAQVCSGAMSLAEAQRLISTDWTAVLPQLGH